MSHKRQYLVVLLHNYVEPLSERSTLKGATQTLHLRNTAFCQQVKRPNRPTNPGNKPESLIRKRPTTYVIHI